MAQAGGLHSGPSPPPPWPQSPCLPGRGIRGGRPCSDYPALSKMSSRMKHRVFVLCSSGACTAVSSLLTGPAGAPSRPEDAAPTHYRARSSRQSPSPSLCGLSRWEPLPCLSHLFCLCSCCPLALTHPRPHLSPSCSYPEPAKCPPHRGAQTCALCLPAQEPEEGFGDRWPFSCLMMANVEDWDRKTL